MKEIILTPNDLTMNIENHWYKFPMIFIASVKEISEYYHLGKHSATFPHVEMHYRLRKNIDVVEKVREVLTSNIKSYSAYKYKLKESELSYVSTPPLIS